MKALIILILSVNCYAQVSIYQPKNTMHFKQSPRYVDNQGGDKGLIFTYTNNNIAYSVGAIRNSYGCVSKVATIGFQRDFNRFSTVYSIGVANGYDMVFYRGYEGVFGVLPKFMKSNGIIPIVLATIKIPVYNNIGVQINVSPAYVNTGVYILLPM